MGISNTGIAYNAEKLAQCELQTKQKLLCMKREEYVLTCGETETDADREFRQFKL